MRNYFGLALLLVALLIVPSAAMAESTKCLCNTGKTINTTRDGEDACESVCDMFGGGRVWTPEDDANQGDGDDAAATRPSGDGDQPAAATSGTEDPRFRP